MEQALRIHDADNVAVALGAIAKGSVVHGVVLVDDIPAGHKVAIDSIGRGKPIVKYGHPIGAASCGIRAGEHVHSHNTESLLRDNLAERYYERGGQRAVLAPESMATFEGYRRSDGRVGIRNEIWIVNTVGCVNNAAIRIAELATREGLGENIDGVFAFPHPFGCSQLGADLENTQKVLAGLVRHPNAGGVVILGLGCENNQLGSLLRVVGSFDPERVQFLNAQQVGNEVEEGLLRVRAVAKVAGRARREPIPASELVIGMKCGGSDGFSGITANPLVGRIANKLTALGGTALLTEVPEMFGAEQVLLGRAVNARVFDATVGMVNEFRAYFRDNHQPIDENPSPGNKDGGITTLAEKSLGCVQKGGTAPIAQVLSYGEPASPNLGGVALINAPGNDAVSSTALTVAGAHIILFTTGRGTPLGVPVPTLKISTNTDLAHRKPSWIDFDAGPVAEGKATFEQLGDALFAQVLDVASGRVRARNEINGFREIAIWKTGVTL